MNEYLLSKMEGYHPANSIQFNSIQFISFQITNQETFKHHSHCHSNIHKNYDIKSIDHIISAYTIQFKPMND